MIAFVRMEMHQQIEESIKSLLSVISYLRMEYSSSSSSSMLSIESLVSEVKNEILSELMSNDVDAFLSPSAYDSAWLAMIPHHNNPKIPMFSSCLDWIVKNQKEEGFWGECDEEDLPTIDALSSTIACLVALKLWIPSHPNIQSGLRFIQSKTEILLKLNYQKLPRWFVLSFPAMIELAEETGLHLAFPHRSFPVIADIFAMRHRILQTEKYNEEEELGCFPPVAAHLEALPSTYKIDPEDIITKYISSDGSLFQSPSATAKAFMSTSNIHSLHYLQSLLHKFPNGGVPAKYPVDGELIKLSMVDHIQGLGLAPYFNHEINGILTKFDRSEKKNRESNGRCMITTSTTIPLKLYKDALTFRLLRMHGHYVDPGSFCWFLHEPKTMSYMEDNCEQFMSAMYNVYRATDLSFPGESEMDQARNFASKLLQNSKSRHRDHNFLITKGLQNMIKYEVYVPWTCRLDRLYHRKWIEQTKMSPLWIGKASFYRLSCFDNTKLMQLAVENFEFMQSIYARELEELKWWSKKWRLSEMGFGREKTLYTYFAVASCSLFPHNSIMRLVIAKAAIIVTVADDFYDMEGTLHDLEILTDAVQRWDGKGLEGHSKTIFDALDHFVHDTVAKCYPQQATKALPILQHLWRECFMAWMVERRWSITGHRPTMEEYFEMGMTSIAAHTIALPATTFLNQNQTPSEYQNITKLLMAITRLANDTQSYQKEVEDGKMNMVVLHSLGNPNGSMEESVEYVKEMLQLKRKEFIKHVFCKLDEDEQAEMPKSCKQTHLYCMKVFEMFFNSANLFDSDTALVEDIQKSLYLPIDVHHRKPLKPIIPSLNNNHQKSKVSARFHQPVVFRPSHTTNFFKNSYVVVGPPKLHLPMRFHLHSVGLRL
uniref:Terpene synthase 13 n=1 Tax=Prunella vulgaris TaxID=39358 RepID=A0A6B7LAG2_PRUVU|nr:terpene synthase 13 [Prunella vulgaris]